MHFVYKLISKYCLIKQGVCDLTLSYGKSSLLSTIKFLLK